MSDNGVRYERVDLEDHADLSAVPEQTEGYSDPSRSDLLSMALGLDPEQIGSVRVGGYQGTMLFVFEHAGYTWLLKDSYGSCSGCDGLLSAGRGGSYRDYARGMLRNAYAFSDRNDAVRFLTEKGDEDPGYLGDTFAYGWGPLVDDGLDELANR